MHAFLSLSSLFLALGLMKFNTNLSQVKVFARFCLSKQTLNSTYDILWSTTGLSASDILVVEYSFDGGFTGWDQLSSGTVADFKGRFR
jgi:hypothetical protein